MTMQGITGLLIAMGPRSPIQTALCDATLLLDVYMFDQQKPLLCQLSGES